MPCLKWTFKGVKIVKIVERELCFFIFFLIFIFFSIYFSSFLFLEL